MRACPPETEHEDDHHYPGTYRAGLYDRRALRSDGTELGHSSLVNLPNWLTLTFRIEGDTAWFSLCRSNILDYRHGLDMARGLAWRDVLVRDSQGRLTQVREQRLVSMQRPRLAALRLEITPENWSGRLELRSALNGAITNHNTDRGWLAGYRHVEGVATCASPEMLLLTGRTTHSGVGFALAARTRVNPPAARSTERAAETVTEHFACAVAAGTTLVVEKTAAIATGRDPATGAPREAARAALATAPDFATLRDEQALAWDQLWARIGIEATEPMLARGVAFHAFLLLQTVSPHSAQLDAGLPSRGWQEAYHGQIFWDEIFAFPFLNHRFPEIARALLLYRYRRLPQARAAARAAGFAGAMFPWRSAASGEEETPSFQYNPLSGTWTPDHTRLQRHIGAAIAHNTWQYYCVTGDEAFLAEYGAEMMVEIARFWASIARHDPRDNRFDIRGVIGPDEYHNAYPGAPTPGLDNNAYTNVMAAVSLLRAGTALDRLPPDRRAELARTLRLDDDELARWRHVAHRLRLCFQASGVLSQFEGFSGLKPFDAAGFAREHPNGRVDWRLAARGDTVDAYQVSKQADVLMLMYLFAPGELTGLVRSMGYPIDTDTLRRTATYYLDHVITHESSLSRLVCAGALAALDLARSWEFFARGLCIDFAANNSASAEEGLHLGAMAGTLDVLQRHYLGLRTADETLVLAPAIPPALGPVRMRLRHRGAGLAVDWDGVTLRLRGDPDNRVALPVLHAGKRHSLAPGECLVTEER